MPHKFVIKTPLLVPGDVTSLVLVPQSEVNAILYLM
jgi:hypothetical protein